MLSLTDCYEYYYYYDSLDIPPVYRIPINLYGMAIWDDAQWSQLFLSCLIDWNFCFYALING